MRFKSLWWAIESNIQGKNSKNHIINSIKMESKHVNYNYSETIVISNLSPVGMLISKFVKIEVKKRSCTLSFYKDALIALKTRLFITLKWYESITNPNGINQSLWCTHTHTHTCFWTWILWNFFYLFFFPLRHSSP